MKIETLLCYSMPFASYEHSLLKFMYKVYLPHLLLAYGSIEHMHTQTHSQRPISATQKYPECPAFNLATEGLWICEMKG